MNEIKNRDVSDIIKKKFLGHSLGILFKNNNNFKKVYSSWKLCTAA